MGEAGPKGIAPDLSQPPGPLRQEEVADSHGSVACPSLLSPRSTVLSLASWLLPDGGSCSARRQQFKELGSSKPGLEYWLPAPPPLGTVWP